MPFIWYKRFCAIILLVITILLAGCGNENPSAPGTTRIPVVKQALTFPYIGTSDIATADPTLAMDANSDVVMHMIYTGLVKMDKDLNIVPDQATWKISTDHKVYTFTIAPTVTFSDGTAVTAESYIYTWTRAISSAGSTDLVGLFSKVVVGASDVANGNARVVSGLKALGPSTLQVTLTQATPYFLALLSNTLFFPLNEALLNQNGQRLSLRVAESGIGTGPFIIKDWEHNVKMVFAPNLAYYGEKTRLTEITIFFVSDASTAFKAYRAGQYDFVWGLAASDQMAGKAMPGFLRVPLLQTDALFFDNGASPFDNIAMRQAFAYATDKATLAHTVFKDSVIAAHGILPPGMPGYQADFAGLTFDGAKAKELLQSVYPDISQVPPITFSYPTSKVSVEEALALQKMWQSALGIQVTLRPLDSTAYMDELQRHMIPFGFVSWGADFPDPYGGLTENLFSTASGNIGRWNSSEFDQAVTLADTLTGEARLELYNAAEQIAVLDVSWLPLDHPTMAAVVPPWVHGVALNGNGLFFDGDWSGVYLSSH